MTEEARLASLLFGTAQPLLQENENDSDETEGFVNAIQEEKEIDFEFVEDKESSKEQNEGILDAEDIKEKRKRKAVWADPEDASITVNVGLESSSKAFRNAVDETLISGKEMSKRLRQRYEDKTSSSWSKIFEKANSKVCINELGAEEEELFGTDAQLVETAAPIESGAFTAGQVELEPAPDANKQSPSSGSVSSMDWHKSESLFVTTGGRNRRVNIFQVDGKANPLVHSARLKDLYLRTAKFCGPSDEELICTGQRKHFYSMDIQSGNLTRVPFLTGREERDLSIVNVSKDGKLISFCGDNGSVIFMSQRNKQVVDTVRMNGSALDADFSSCGNYLLSTGSSGEIYKWDLRRFRCVGKHRDYGSTCTNVIRMNPIDDSVYATGLNTGVVNVYKNSVFHPDQDITPLKEAMNIRTSIDDLSFSTDGNLLSFCSSDKSRGAKIMAMNDLSIVPTFPKLAHTIGCVSRVGFSFNNEYLALGNEGGRCRLFRVNNYIRH